MRLATIAWRGLVARPLRTALTVSGVALGVAVVAATIITGAAADAALRAPPRTSSGAPTFGSAPSTTTGFTPRTVQALRAHAGRDRRGARVASVRLTVHAARARTSRSSRCS